MSDTGLHANFYEQVRGYAQQLDELLIQLSSPAATIHSDLTKRVELLVGQLREPSRSEGIALQLLSFQARHRRLFSEKHWLEIAESLRSNSISPPLLDRLEVLARFLEEQRAGAVAKMRGR